MEIGKQANDALPAMATAAVGSTRQCGVCLEPLTAGDAIGSLRGSCDHEYHLDCIKRWSKEANT